MTPDTFWSRVDKQPGGCWLWRGAMYQNGYGRICSSVSELAAGKPRNQLTHRFAYELVVGPIADGLVLDHLCRVKACVNPDHLDPVTPQENSQRGARGRMVTVCTHGHPYTPDNTYIAPGDGRRRCVSCRRWHKQRELARNRARRTEGAAA